MKAIAIDYVGVIAEKWLYDRNNIVWIMLKIGIELY
jgi:hypothetical protein